MRKVILTELNIDMHDKARQFYQHLTNARVMLSTVCGGPDYVDHGLGGGVDLSPVWL